MNPRRTAFIALLLALGSTMYVVESFVPFPLPVPGGRWGFSNLVILVALPGSSLRDLIFISLGKNTLGNLMAGRLATPGFFMGIAGILTAALVMWVMSRLKNRFGLLGISLAGAVANNSIQLTFAAIFLVKNNGIFSLYPYFIMIGSISSIANAIITKIVLDRIGGSLWIKK